MPKPFVLPAEYTPSLSCVDTGSPWKVVLYIPDVNLNGWWIFNTDSRKMRYVGPIRSKGTNYYDRAHLLAEGLNRQLEGGSK